MCSDTCLSHQAVLETFDSAGRASIDPQLNLLLLSGYICMWARFGMQFHVSTTYTLLVSTLASNLYLHHQFPESPNADDESRTSTLDCVFAQPDCADRQIINRWCSLMVHAILRPQANLLLSFRGSWLFPGGRWGFDRKGAAKDGWGGEKFPTRGDPSKLDRPALTIHKPTTRTNLLSSIPTFIHPGGWMIPAHTYKARLVL